MRRAIQVEFRVFIVIELQSGGENRSKRRFSAEFPGKSGRFPISRDGTRGRAESAPLWVNICFFEEP